MAAASARAILLMGLLSPAARGDEVPTEETLAVALRFFPALVVLQQNSDERLDMVVSVENRGAFPLVVLHMAGRIVLPDGESDAFNLGGPFVIRPGAHLVVEGPLCVPSNAPEGTASVGLAAVFRPLGTVLLSRRWTEGYFQVVRR